MAAAVIQEPETPEATPHIERVEDLPDPVRADIIARRQAGETLAELKTRFAFVDPAVIREVLPPGNARERKAREAKAKVTETTQGTGGRSGKAPKSEPKTEPKPAPEPRYATGTERLCERVAAARQVVGRTVLATLLEASGSAVWRWERNRVHPSELAGLEANLAEVEAKIRAGDFVKPERQPKASEPSKADLRSRIDAAAQLVDQARQHAKAGTKVRELLDRTLAVLEPPRPSES